MIQVRSAIVCMMSFLGIATISCSNSLKSQFEDCYSNKISPIELLQTPTVKKRIVNNYSQQYYTKLLANADVYTRVYYDSIQDSYYVYGRKKNIKNDIFETRLRYYRINDSLAVTLKMHNVEIDKTGDSDYTGWESNVDKYIRTIENKVQQGSASAQYILGKYHSSAKSDIVTSSLKKAKYYFQQSAAQYNTQSQYMLGMLNCIDGNVNEGLELLEKAALQGNQEAQDLLGVLYFKGEYVPINYEKSIMWFSKLSEHGGNIEQSTLYNLGGIYLNKIKDSAKALFYYQKSAELGYSKAQLRLALEYFDKYSYSSTFVEPDQQMGLKWLRIAAKQGDPTAQQLLSVLLTNQLVIDFENLNDNVIEEGERWQKALESNPDRDNVDNNFYERILFCFVR